ncbi:MAG: helix-turn-helix transcriptional regulator [Bacillota bacterium]
MKKVGLILLSFLGICSFIFYDLFLDWGSHAPKVHLFFEFLVGLASLAWLLFFLKKYLLLLRLHALSAEEVKEWKQRASQLSEGLTHSIDVQFNTWGLTETEKEIALLLVKGLATKEIATIRDCSERTVRQHAQAIYSKSNLAGRAELAAYFIEDLLISPEIK